MTDELQPVTGAAAQEHRARLRADGALVFLTVLWGTTFVVVKDALSHGDPFSFLALRFGVGARGAQRVWRGARVLSPSHLRRGAVLGLFLFAGFALQTVGLTDTTPARSAFFTGLYVLLVPLVMLAVFRRVPRVSSLVGVVLSAMGLYYLTRRGRGRRRGCPEGIWLTLGCAVAYAFHITFTERYAPKEGVEALVAVQLWVVSLLSALCLPFAGARVEWTPAFLGAVVFCGVFASAVGAQRADVGAGPHVRGARGHHLLAGAGVRRGLLRGAGVRDTRGARVGGWGAHRPGRAGGGAGLGSVGAVAGEGGCPGVSGPGAGRVAAWVLGRRAGAERRWRTTGGARRAIGGASA